LFQFYSQTPYLVAAVIDKYVTGNPWLALKMAYLVALWAGGFLVFKLGELMGFDRGISVLTGVVYITAPYLLINIHSRGAFTEAFAQLALPAVAYSSARLIKCHHPADILWTSLAWLVVGTSHVITFVYSTIFYLLFVVCLGLFRRIGVRTASILVIACALGWSLSAFHWYPALTTPLRVQRSIGGVFYTRWLTPVSSLLSLTSNPPEPLGGRGYPFLNPALGLPILISTVGILYLRRALESDSSEIWSCMVPFIVALLGTWAPVDFWAVLPPQLQVLQFTYRLLVYTTVFGTMLFAYFLSIYKRHYGLPGFLLCLVALLILCQPYLPMLEQNSRTLSSIVAAPETSYSGDAYLFDGAVPQSLTSYRDRYEARLPLAWPDNWLMIGYEMDLAKSYVDSLEGSLLIRGDAGPRDIQPFLDGRCAGLAVILDGGTVATREIGSGLFEWRVATSAFRSFFHGPTGKLGFRSECGFVPSAVDPKAADSRRLWIRILDLRFESAGGREFGMADTRRHCALENARMTCDLDLATPTDVQLPMLFYPSLLRISVNGRPADYHPSYNGQEILTSVSLGAGHNSVVGRFAGSAAGNTVSAAAGALILALICWGRWHT
jgi:hypothetical protein